MKTLFAFQTPYDPIVGIPYGNVTCHDDFPFAGPDGVTTIALYTGRRRCRWPEIMKILSEYRDFIWSDDEHPWVTTPAAQALMKSELRGIKLEPTFLHYVDDNNVAKKRRAQAPLIYRAVFLPYEPGADFCENQRDDIWHWASKEAIEWLRSQGWRNFEVGEHGNFE